MIILCFFLNLKQYKRLEQEINENWSSNQQEQSHQPQKSSLLLSAATLITEKPSNI